MSMSFDLIHSYSQKLQAFKGDFCRNYLAIGALLLIVRDEKLWKDAGASSFVEWLTSEGLSRAWGYRCAQIYEKWNDRALGILPERLTQLLPLQMTEEQEAEMLVAARELPAGAFQDAVRVARGQTPSDEEGCEHEFQTRCRKCGRLA